MNLIVQLTVIVLSLSQRGHADISKYSNNILVYKPEDEKIVNTTNTTDTWSFTEPDDSHGWIIYVKGDELTLKTQSSNITEELFGSTTTMKPANSDKCKPTITQFSCNRICSGDLIFEENFDTFDSTKWQHEVRLVINDGEFVSYQNRSENCYVNSGQLHIMPSLLSETPGFNSNLNTELDLTKSGCRDERPEICKLKAPENGILPPIVSARIRTIDSFKFRYGRVEVRAKLPKGDWIFPLILLEPYKNMYKSTSDHLRVAFARGNEELFDNTDGKDISGRRLYGGAFLGSLQKYRYVRIVDSIRGEHLGNDFHVYSLTWTDKFISMAIDGNEYATIAGGFSNLQRTHGEIDARLWRLGKHMAPFDQEFYITLGVAVGGHNDFPDGSHNPYNFNKKPWQNVAPKAQFQFWQARHQWFETWKGDNVGLHVDYVRVYAI